MIELRTLGSLDLHDPAGREILSVLAQPKRLALLTYLAVAAPGGFVRRDTLLAMFWPESDDERARGAFRQAVRYLRRSLGEGVVVNRAEDELGIAEGVLSCDATAFQAALRRGDQAGALALYRGDLLPGFLVAGAPQFESWLDGERARLRASATAAAWSLADGAATAGDLVAARGWAGRALALAPLDENGVRRWITLLDAAGDRAAAVHAFEEFARRLRDELDLEPAPRTRALVEEIRLRDAARELPGSPVRQNGGDREDDIPAASDRSGAARPGGRVDPPGAPEAVAGSDAGTPALATITSPRVSRGSKALRRLMISGAVMVLAVAGLAYAKLPRATEPSLNPRRVVVAPFENRTGDPALDPVASMVADWIIQGLAGRGAIEVVPVTAVLASFRHLSPSARSDGTELDLRPLARETGAGTVISGSYYRQGDSLHFQVRITDAFSGRVAVGIEPVGSPVDVPLDGIDRLRDRVLVALAPLSDERDTHLRLARAPPSYQAYRSYVAGFESFVRQDIPSALRDFERAAAEDSTFVMPAIAAAIMHMNLRQEAAADSVARRVTRFRDEMGPLERATLDMLQGWLRGDNEAAFEAARRQAKIAPGSIGEYQVAEQARVLNRASETVRVLTEMEADRGELRGWFAYWRELTAAHHMLGNHRDELRAARRARELHPGNVRVLFHEIQALAALGQVAAVHERIEERLASPSRDWPSPGALMAAAARELRAHGRPEPAEALFERSLAWYRAQSTAGDRATDYGPSIGTVLYDSGRWQDAGALFTKLAAEAPENVEYQGYLGVLAARSNDRAAAQRVAAGLGDLEQPYLRGAQTLWRARIAAVLGEDDLALELLREAFAQGRQHGTSHHTDVDLDPLRHHPRFVALMRPR
jgi:DNA-binding SARP family transcriptional activator/tetratricopeptide (TPR) repeat protein/TolB-like protein